MLLADCSKDGVFAGFQIREELHIEKLCKRVMSECPNDQ